MNGTKIVHIKRGWYITQGKSVLNQQGVKYHEGVGES